MTAIFVSPCASCADRVRFLTASVMAEPRVAGAPRTTLRGRRGACIGIAGAPGPPAPREPCGRAARPTKRGGRAGGARAANNEPLAIENAVVPAELLPSPELVTISLYAALAKLGHRPAT